MLNPVDFEVLLRRIDPVEDTPVAQRMTLEPFQGKGQIVKRLLAEDFWVQG